MKQKEEAKQPVAQVIPKEELKKADI